MTKQWIFTFFAHSGHTNIVFLGHFESNFEQKILFFFSVVFVILKPLKKSYCFLTRDLERKKMTSTFFLQKPKNYKELLISYLLLFPFNLSQSESIVISSPHSTETQRSLLLALQEE